MKNATSSGLRLMRFEIHNFTGVRALCVTPNGNHVRIKGPNGSGKTSALDCLWQSLKESERSLAGPEVPITDGELEAFSRIDLGQFIVERHWERGKKTSKVVVKAPDGSRYSDGMEMINDLISRYSMDPAAFLKLKPKEQIKEILAVSGIQAPVDQVQKITGEVIPSNEDEAADAYLDRLCLENKGLFYDRRKEAGRALDQRTKALDAQRRMLSEMPPAPAETSATDILKKIDDLNKKDDERRGLERAVDAAKREEQDAIDTLEEYKDGLAKAQTECQDILVQIEALKRRLAGKEQQVADLKARIDNGERNVIPSRQQKCQELAVKLAAVPDLSGKIAALRKDLANVEANAAIAAKRKAAEETLDRLTNEEASARKDHAYAEDVLNAIRDLRAKLIAGLNLGIEGLQIGDGELRYKGLPFAQASNAERLRVACAIAMYGNPRLKLLRIDNAECLDEESQEMIRQLADENGWQVISAVVDHQYAGGTKELSVEIIEKAAA